MVLPFFHSFGLHAGILCCLMMGATIVPLQVFEPAATMKRIVDERITAFPGAPAMYQAILNHPDADAFDASSLRLAILGAAAIPVELVQAMRGRLGIETVVTGYGITEGSGIVTMCRFDDPPEVIAHTCGRPLPGLELRLVDDDGVDAATEAPGEVLVRGYTLMRGYLDDPEQTAEAIDTDGWLHTGDIGVLRADGNLVITDRKKDMFVVGGFNVYPAEIENVMLSHPAVGQVAVVGIPDARLGEVGMAYVIAAPRHRARSRRDRRVVPARDGQLQGAAPGGDRRRAPAERQWQGPQVRVARPRRRDPLPELAWRPSCSYVPPAEMLVETDGPVTDRDDEQPRDAERVRRPAARRDARRVGAHRQRPHVQGRGAHRCREGVQRRAATCPASSAITTTSSTGAARCATPGGSWRGWQSSTSR